MLIFWKSLKTFASDKLKWNWESGLELKGCHVGAGSMKERQNWRQNVQSWFLSPNFQPLLFCGLTIAVSRQGHHATSVRGHHLHWALSPYTYSSSCTTYIAQWKNWLLLEVMASYIQLTYVSCSYIQAKSKRNPASQPGKFQSLYWSRSAETRIPIKMPHGHQAETGLLGTILD